MKDWVLGLGGSDHDGSAALMHRCDIRVAIEEERLTRRKHGMSRFYDNPVQRSVRYCLDACGIALDDVDVVSSDLLSGRARFEFRSRNLKFYPHHLCHAAAAYMMCPPASRAAILVYDGAGSIQGRTDDDPPRNVRETFTFYLFDNDKISCLGQTCGTGVREHDDFPSSLNDSVGFLYEFVSGLLGFDVMDSGKTMGLAAHGTPRYVSEFEQYIGYGSTTEACFRCELDSPDLRDTLEAILRSNGGSFQVKADIAASAQAIVNKTLLHVSQFFDEQKFDVLCVSGGCALNTVANSHLVEKSRSNAPVIIPPHAGDSGLALGALWLAAREKGEPVSFRGGNISPAIARPGRVYTTAECHDAVRDHYPLLALDASIENAEQLAREIACGSIVGLFNGPSEIGPRALGGRSILADPRAALIREKLNRQVKHREPFRPLAPMILFERFAEYFDDARQSDPFMLKVARATDRCKREAPAVVHIDGTARIQVVDMNGDPFLRRLLDAFAKETGLPLILNTSFNRRGEPIVETPDDAIDAFLAMKLDGLYLDGSFYRAVPS